MSVLLQKSQNSRVIQFGGDTKHRKQWFTGLSFSHPAKMSLPLQLWLIENFTKEGETILDPMAGSGTLLVACSLGRDVICVELESKFCDMMKGNWERIRQRGTQMGYQMGQAVIMRGDARNLTGILADRIITSPPYASGGTKADENPANYIRREEERLKIFPNRPKTFIGRYSGNRDNIGNLPYGQIDKIVSSPPYEGTEARDRWKESWWDEEREKKMSGGSAKIAKGYQPDAIITSPPYEEAMGEKHHSPRADKLAEEKHNPVTYTDKVDHIITSPPYIAQTSTSKQTEGLFKGRELFKEGRDPQPHGEGQIGDLSYGQIDAVISSPPYEGSIIDGNENFEGLRKIRGDKASQKTKFREVQFGKETTAYGKKQVDAVISSPPYGDAYSIGEGGQVNTKYVEKAKERLRKQGKDKLADSLRIEEYSSRNPENIGDLKSTDYLSAMLAVYQQCYAVLKPGGLMVLVVKNFIRDKAIIRLDEDTIKLCEKAGFVLKERHYRRLTQQSFWRTIYARRYPDAPTIAQEDILLFEKAG